MNIAWIAKQMIDFQQTVFDNTYSAVSMIQDHSEKVTGTLLAQAVWMPEAGRHAANQWTEACKKGRDDLKAAVDENFDKAKGLFASQ